ncbi:hypothetical protein Pmani_020125 [Petrolisthes manimaculis]|uniref:WD repeat-containing protein 55 homolog n=1 Tax=Petrolisthes manimaculis TaxID=1843537 RepID=A0AAE1PJD3_9EUCA|nr:hypothetical protein Pmani_020125 [Petrolisthes manimaculis]
MAEYKLHNVRFYDFEPKSIQCMSYEEKSCRLALSRADGSIEIWNCQDKPFLQKVLPGGEESSVEGVAWCGERLFSAGLQGFILEHDLVTNGILSRTSVTGGPTWCLAASPSKTKLAAGTEEGYLNIFKVVDSGITYEQTLKRQEGRILHLSWHSSEDYIVTGSINCACLWSLKNERMMLCSIPPSGHQEIIVWCVGILDDMTIVSGDSRGRICFWNGKLGVVTEVIQTHKADILSLVVGADQKTVFVAGVHPLIVRLNRVALESREVGKKERWIIAVSRNVHTHDIRALVLSNSSKLFSGGVDTILNVSSYSPFKMEISFRAHPPRGSISVAGAASCLLLKQRERLELWRLGSHFPTSEVQPSNFLHLDEDRVKLLEVKSPGGEVIDWCCVSSEAIWIAYIVTNKLRIFQFYPPKVDSKASLRRVRGMSKDIQPSHQAVWLGAAKLASAATTGVVQVLTVSEMETSVERELTLKSGCGVIQMCASADGNTLVVVDDQNEVTVFNVENGDRLLLPVYSSWVTAVGVDPANQLVVVAYADMMIKEFSLYLRRFTDFSRQVLTEPLPQLVELTTTIRHISFDASNPEQILLHNDDCIIILYKNRDAAGSKAESKPAKIKRGMHSLDTSNSRSLRTKTANNISIIRRTNQVLHFSHVREDSLISVELNPLQLQDKLPPTFKVKKYGAR